MEFEQVVSKKLETALLVTLRQYKGQSSFSACDSKKQNGVHGA